MRAEIEAELAHQGLRARRLDGDPAIWNIEGVCLRLESADPDRTRGGSRRRWRREPCRRSCPPCNVAATRWRFYPSIALGRWSDTAAVRRSSRFLRRRRRARPHPAAGRVLAADAVLLAQHGSPRRGRGPAGPVSGREDDAWPAPARASVLRRPTCFPRLSPVRVFGPAVLHADAARSGRGRRSMTSSGTLANIDCSVATRRLSLPAATLKDECVRHGVSRESVISAPLFPTIETPGAPREHRSRPSCLRAA